MLPEVSRMSVSAFDTHLWLAPLCDPALVRPEVRDLADRDALRARRLSGAAWASPRFRLFTLTRELAQTKNNFWKVFAAAAGASAQPPAPADIGEWLLPVRCRPIALAPAFERPGAAAARAYVTVWLWPFGWSTQIDFRLGGRMSLADCRTVVGTLSAGGSRPFRLGAETLSLSELFQRVGGQISGDVVAPGAATPILTQINRRLAVTLTAAPGQALQRFFAAPNADPPVRPRWTDLERGEIASVLAGQPFGSLQAANAATGGGPFKPLSLPNRRCPEQSNLAIAHTELGVLMLLRHPPDIGWSRDGQRCLASNVRASWLAQLALTGLVRKVRGAAGSPAAALVQAATGALAGLKSYYSNPVFQALAA